MSAMESHDTGGGEFRGENQFLTDNRFVIYSHIAEALGRFLEVVGIFLNLIRLELKRSTEPVSTR